MGSAPAVKDWLTDERRQEILAIVQREGRALVVELAKRFSTSTITIRKDLEYLQNRGQVQRTHGGPSPYVPTSSPILRYRRRRSSIIARSCASHRRLSAR